MKKVFFMAALSCATILSANAQQQGEQHRKEGHGMKDGTHTMPTAQEMADKETMRETKMLNLTQEQVAKAKVINLDYSQQRADLMKSMASTDDRAAMENKMKGIRMAQDNALKAILTPEQQAILTKKHSEMGDDKGGKMGGAKMHKKGQKPSGATQGTNDK